MFVAKPTYLFLTVIRLFHDGLGHVIQIFLANKSRRGSSEDDSLKGDPVCLEDL